MKHMLSKLAASAALAALAPVLAPRTRPRRPASS